MARTARKKSTTGIYHIMLRGNNKEVLFYEDEDYQKVLKTIKYCIEKSGIEIYAYCIMPNHIHLLIKEGAEPLEVTFKRFGCKFVYWYNMKYKRVGHLFQDRFKSEAVEDDSYFLTVLRYIHNNPVKACLSKKPEDYDYSSYNSYFKKNEFVSTGKALSMISRKELIRYHNSGNDDNCLEIPDESLKKLTDEEALIAIKRITKNCSKEDFKDLNNDEKLQLIREMKKSGASIRQISEYSCESYYYIQKA